MKQVVVIGLGQFGSHLARELAGMGCEIMVIDQDEARVDALKSDVYQAVICDVRQRDAVEAVLTSEVDEVILGLGENMEPSILCTLHLKQLGVKRIRCTAVNEDHATILRAVGADEIIFPERETAERTARRVAYPSLLDYFPFEEDHRIMELKMPSSLSGKRLGDSNIRSDYDLLVLGTKDANTGKFKFMPGATDVLSQNDVLIVLGREVNLARFQALD